MPGGRAESRKDSHEENRGVKTSRMCLFAVSPPAKEARRSLANIRANYVAPRQHIKRVVSEIRIPRRDFVAMKILRHPLELCAALRNAERVVLLVNLGFLDLGVERWTDAPVCGRVVEISIKPEPNPPAGPLGQSRVLVR